jgi:GMP synthase-like glutamine amidotransferase
MRAHYLQHVPFEGLGSIEPWLKDHGCEITQTRFYESIRLPDCRDVDLLIIMGGPMSANDEEEFPWLVKEKAFIRQCIESGTAVLGVCLGSQLIASALGGKVYRNPQKEIGWFPVQGVSSSGRSVFRFPREIDVFHWHGETFDLPPGAVRTATNEACENQAIQLGRSVIGLQFHLETTAQSLQALVSHCRSELIPSIYVQTETTILSAGADKFRVINNLMALVLFYLTNRDDR